ncbi:DotD/TraH family lipoprotein [Azohydromonas australica]|uniref:DotD/TraH family lipoprotein n=1 Tax=Azohydromonas australica TaxID=364039 RepID=UPI00048EFA7E|nr:DotD/TraH family lipoprotein [Azohydromonas australica]
MHDGQVLFTASVLAAAALTGCAWTPKEPLAAGPMADAQALVDAQILDAAAKLQRSQAELFQAAALNAPVEPAAADIRDDGQPVTLTWRGDAAELLRRLARDRGLGFASAGVRLPLPVKLSVKDEPFAGVLQLLRAQIGFRAIVSQVGDRIILEYSRPQ